MSRSGSSLTGLSCVGPLPRREFLRIGLTGLGSLTLPGLWQLRARAAAAPPPRSGLP
jgi:hypothetical protein